MESERLESKIKPRLRAEVRGLRVVCGEMKRIGLLSFDNCAGRPINKNSVFEGLSERAKDRTLKDSLSILCGEDLMPLMLTEKDREDR